MIYGDDPCIGVHLRQLLFDSVEPLPSLTLDDFMSMLPFHLQNTMLPEDYKVGPNDVIIGRGKKCTLNPGNQRFRAIVQTTLEAYSNAETKVKKSEIIMGVLTQVRQGSSVGFVKQHSGTGRYLQVEEASCRIAIAQAFRDALSGTYKSSKKHKQIRRLERLRASETEQTLAANAAQVQGLVREGLLGQEMPSLPMKSRADTCSNSATMFHLQGLLESVNANPGVANNNALPLSLPNTMFMTRPAANFMGAAPQPTLPPTLNLATANNDFLASLINSIGTEMAQVSDPFEPTPLPHQQTGFASFNNHGSRVN